MCKGKRKRELFDRFGFAEDFFNMPESFAKGGSAYSISVTYDEKGKPVVKVQTQGNVDVAELRKDIEQRYPGARIEGLEKQPLIRVVNEKPTAEKEKPKEEPVKKRKKEKREPLIRVVE